MAYRNSGNVKPPHHMLLSYISTTYLITARHALSPAPPRCTHSAPLYRASCFSLIINEEAASEAGVISSMYNSGKASILQLTISYRHGGKRLARGGEA